MISHSGCLPRIHPGGDCPARTFRPGRHHRAAGAGTRPSPPARRTAQPAADVLTQPPCTWAGNAARTAGTCAGTAPASPSRAAGRAGELPVELRRGVGDDFPAARGCPLGRAARRVRGPSEAARRPPHIFRRCLGRALPLLHRTGTYRSLFRVLARRSMSQVLQFW